MAGAGAGPYSHLQVGMILKHFKSGRCGVVHDWSDRSGDPYVYLYFADREPADKNENRRMCYEWRRLSVFVPMSDPFVKEKASEGDEHDAKKMAEDVTPPGDGEQGAAAADSTNLAMQLLTADSTSLADDDYFVVDEALEMHRKERTA